jgi:hypothetical protein
MSVRFSPDACPGCGEPLRPKYSTYRTGKRSRLFPAGLIVGVVAIAALILLSFWGAAILTEELFADAPLARREKGMLTFLLQIPMVLLIVFGARIGWRLLHRLPRTFFTGCQTCTWTGLCKVYENPSEV